MKQVIVDRIKHIVNGNVVSRKILSSPLSKIIVERMKLDTAVFGEAEPSIIAKYIPSASANVERFPSFMEEVVNYRFLMDLGRDFKPYPQLYYEAGGLMLIQDLGEDNVNYSNRAQCAIELADTFAELHCSTFGKANMHNKLRKQYGLPSSDNRVMSMNEQNLFFDIGYQYLVRTSVFDEKNHQITNSKLVVNNPGLFYTFIHDDISARRQTISDNQGIKFIDFETGKYAHSLLDLARPVVGKIERKIKLNRYFLNNPGFSSSFWEMYMDKVFSLRGKFVEKNEFLTHFLNCCVFTSIANIGVALRANEMLPPLTSLGKIISEIIWRLICILEQNNSNGFSEIRKLAN